MKTALSITSMLLAFPLLVACGDDEDTADNTDTGDPPDEPGETGVITGTIEVAQLGGGDESIFADGVTVEVIGTETSTTTDAQGFYSIEAPAATVQLRATKDDHWGYIFTVGNVTEGRTEIDFEVIPDTLVAEVNSMILGNIDAQKGVVFFDFNTQSTAGGERADVVDDGGTGVSEGMFTIDENGDFVEEPPQLTTNGDTFILHYGVPPGTAKIDVGGVTAINTCAAVIDDITDWPIEAKIFTYVEVFCPDDN